MLAGGTEDKEHAMSQKLDTSPAVIGIDIGKNSFHIVGQNQRGAIVLRQKWSRGQVEARLANLPPCRIGMEACVGAHHLSRTLKALGHDARLMPAKYVRPYSKGQKNDSSVCGRRTKSYKFVNRQVSFVARTSHPVSECVGGSRPGCHQPFPSSPASRNASSEGQKPTLSERPLLAQSGHRPKLMLSAVILMAFVELQLLA
jgi:hypothetical protein